LLNITGTTASGPINPGQNSVVTMNVTNLMYTDILLNDYYIVIHKGTINWIDPDDYSITEDSPDYRGSTLILNQKVAISFTVKSTTGCDPTGLMHVNFYAIGVEKDTSIPVSRTNINGTSFTVSVPHTPPTVSGTTALYANLEIGATQRIVCNVSQT